MHVKLGRGDRLEGHARGGDAALSGLGVITAAPEVEALAASVPDSGGVVFVPALTGLGAPDWDPNARGLIVGITRATSAAALSSACLRGCVPA